MKRNIVKVEKNESNIIVNPIMSLCFSNDSLNIVKSIKRMCSNIDEICMLGVKYRKQIGDDIQFAITGKVSRNNKGKFIEDNNYAMERELGEELGLCVNSDFDSYKYENILLSLEQQQLKLEQKLKKLDLKLSNKNNTFFKGTKMLSSKRVFNGSNVYSFRAKHFDIFDGIINNEPENRLLSEVKYRNNAGITRVITVTPESVITPTNNSFLLKTVYQAYLFNINCCSPLKKNATLKKKATNQIKNINTRPKVCAYIYGSKDEIINLINDINFMFEDADDIEAFIIIKLDDVMHWLKNFKKLLPKPKTNFDKRLKTNFIVESYKFTKCSS